MTKEERAMQDIITVNQLKKLFGNEEALRDVTFSVKKERCSGSSDRVDPGRRRPSKS